MNYRPREFFDRILNEIEIQTKELRILLMQYQNGNEAFRGFLSSVSCTAGDLCDFTNPTAYSEFKGHKDRIKMYCDILRKVVYLSHLMVMFKSILQSRVDALRHMPQVYI
jgi:hypothetical protein